MRELRHYPVVGPVDRTRVAGAHSGCVFPSRTFMENFVARHAATMTMAPSLWPARKASAPPKRRRRGSSGTMYVSFLCLCAIVLVFSISCRDDTGTVQPVSGGFQDVAPTETPTVATEPKPTETPPQSVPTSPVAEPTRQDQQPTVAAEPTPAAKPTVTVETPESNGAPTRAAGPWFNDIAVSGTTETVALPRHHYEPVVNIGFDYLYGELFEADGCLRISFLSTNEIDQIPDGIWIIWPPGFTARRVAGVIEVVSQDGLLMARVGDRVRISGEGPKELVDDPEFWDWSEDAVRDCAGFQWLVGDEVSVVTDEPRTIVSDAGIVVPRVGHQEGAHSAPAALARARLVLRGRCLRLENTRGGTEYVVVWPPGFRVDVRGNRVVVTNGGGAVIVRVGDKFKSGGGVATVPDFPDTQDCSGEGWWAYEVLPLD